MNEIEFRACAYDYMTKLVDHLETQYPALDLEDTEDSIILELSDRRQFLINVHPTSQQIWLSSPFSGAHHYIYDAQAQDWLDMRGSHSLLSQLNSELEKVA